MTQTFLLRETQASGIPKSSGKDGLNLTAGAYRLRFAESLNDLEAAYRLRFLVFNLELGEGLETAYEHGYDSDEFDPVSTTSSSNTAGRVRLWARIACKPELPQATIWATTAPESSISNRTNPCAIPSSNLAARPFAKSIGRFRFFHFSGEASPLMQKNARRATSLAAPR